MTAHIVNTAASPQATLQSVPLDAVRWTEGFWAERYQQACETSVEVLWDLLADPDAGHVLQNFQIAAGLLEG
ncbi:MAG: glycoside hydrolase family 127 protein, partial [Victivallales bacterium]|nr:glycoside hydrolase family 127 protein [Victivallales bacterium]